MLPEADEIYQGTSQINLGTGPGRPWCRYATAKRKSIRSYSYMLYIATDIEASLYPSFANFVTKLSC